MNHINWWSTKPNLIELSSVNTLIRDGDISDGQKCKDVESSINHLLDARYSILTPSGSAALILALLCLEIQADQNIILPACSWIATLNVAKIFNCELRFVDVNPYSGNINVLEVSSLIDNKTACVIAVHLNGIQADIEYLEKILPAHVPIIEDSCQAFGSKDIHGRMLGSQSQYSCFSFGVTKLITCGQGGCFVTTSRKIYEKALAIKNNGVDSLINPHYLYQGLNLKVPGLSASFLESQFKIVKTNTINVSDIYALYKDNIYNSLISFPVRPANSLPLYTQVQIKDGYRPNLINYLESFGVESRPIPASYVSARFIAPSSKQNLLLNGAQQYTSSTLYLPSGPHQQMDHIHFVINLLNRWTAAS